MEFIASYNWSITVGLILLVTGVLIGGAYFIVWYGKLQARLANEYKKYYIRIQTVLTYEVCEANYRWLLRLFDKMYRCRYKNWERTSVLENKFSKKYKEIKKRVSEID